MIVKRTHIQVILSLYTRIVTHKYITVLYIVQTQNTVQTHAHYFAPALERDALKHGEHRIDDLQVIAV